MSFFFGGGGAKVKPQYTGIQLQTSSSTQAIALVWGMNRVAPNIFWYSDFQSRKQKQKAGKGFGGSGTSYTYSASIMLGLCQGPITGLGRVFRDQDKTTDYASLGFSLFLGEQGQAPWGYLTSKHPDQAFSYSNVAYVAAANYDLGASASTPQHSFEIKGMRYNSGPLSNGDADCALVVQDLLTDGEYGAGFIDGTLDLVQLLSSSNATTSGDGTYQTYCRARGFGINPALASQESAGNIIDRWTELTDTAVVWTGYSLKLIPYGTEIVEGNGYRFVPNVTAIYSLSDDDYLAERGQAPLKITRSDPSDANNSLKLTVRNRANEYNDAPVEWKDQGLIDVYGLRQGNNVDATEICSLDMGSLIVSLIGQRLAYTRNTYDFTLPPTFCLMEPMDILILQDPQLGDVAVWIDELEEQDDYSWRVTAKEIPPGIAHAAVAQDISNSPINTAANPGPVNTPVIFQPPLNVSGGVAQVWAAVSGGDDTISNPNWGGAYVYVSTDGISYQQIGQVNSPARQGVLTSSVDAYMGNNPDTSNIVKVNLARSAGDLQSVSIDEASRAATLSYVGGELLSFENANMMGTSNYDLSNLYRGLYGTGAIAHSSGAPFVRLDEAIFKYNLPPEYIGLSLFFKFQSYNIWGGGLQDLADCVEYTYTLDEPVVGSPSNLRSQFGNTLWKGSTLTVYCDPVAGADSYEAEFYLSDGTTLRRAILNSSSSVSYQAAEANSDGISRVYRVRMRAYTSGSPGPWSPMTTFSNIAPTAVTGISGVDGTTTGGVSFTLLSEDDVGGYVIYYSTTLGFDPLTAGNSTQNNGYSPHIIYGLPAGTYYAKIAAFDNWTQQPNLLNFSPETSFTISTGGGSSTPGGGGGGYCVTTDTLILMANEDRNGPGKYKPAGDLRKDEWVWTRHETTMAWGAFPITAVDFENSEDVWQVVFNGNTIKATGGHKVWIPNNWVTSNQFGTPLSGTFEIAKITVEDAHTYISEGILSHNIKQNEAIE